MVEYSWTRTERKIKCQQCKIDVISTNRMQKYCTECALVLRRGREQTRAKKEAKQIDRVFKSNGVML